MSDTRQDGAAPGTGPSLKELRRGIENFNSRRFFEAHESWEEVWLGSPQPERTFLQGIIQLAAAFHHYQRGNVRGACSLLEAGLRRLAGFPDDYGGIALEPLRAAASEWVRCLAEGSDPGPERLPRITVIPKV